MRKDQRTIHLKIKSGQGKPIPKLAVEITNMYHRVMHVQYCNKLKYMVHGTWYMVHGTWYMVHGTWYVLTNTCM